MALTEADRHRVAVVRVEIIDEATRTLLIEFLEVGRDAGGADRYLGSANDVAAGCDVLREWLCQITSGEGGPADG
jgi:hypothetical protein